MSVKDYYDINLYTEGNIEEIYDKLKNEYPGKIFIGFNKYVGKYFIRVVGSFTKEEIENIKRVVEGR